MAKRTNYNRGVEVERKIKQQLEEDGYYVTRSAGSHSKFDIWAVSDLHTLLIQSKRCREFNNSVYADEVRQIREICEGLHRSVQVEFWVWQDKKGFIKKEVIKESK